MELVIDTVHGCCRESTTRSSPSDQDSEGPSELQSFSDSLRSRLNAVSMRYGMISFLNEHMLTVKLNSIYILGQINSFGIKLSCEL